jgi:hypothetical protein
MLTRPVTVIDLAEWSADQRLGRVANAIPLYPPAGQRYRRRVLGLAAAVAGGTAVPAHEFQWIMEADIDG